MSSGFDRSVSWMPAATARFVGSASVLYETRSDAVCSISRFWEGWSGKENGCEMFICTLI